MADLGTDLRQARERAGFSLSDLAARTKIPLNSLRAIEQNDFAKVPPGIFVRSFIRSYAREVGVDPVTAVAEYRAMTEPIEPPEQSSRDHQIAHESPRVGSFVPDLAQSRPSLGYALIVAALLVAVIAMNRYTEPASSPPETTAAVTTADPSIATPQPVATTGTGLQVDMRAQGLCWISAVVDGQRTVARLLQPGETQSLSAERDIVLRVGDPAALSYSVNGRTGQALGAANVPVTVHVGTDGRISRAS